MPTADELLRRRISNMRDELITKILKSSIDIFGPTALDEAWDEFHLWGNDGPFHPDATDVQVFMPWFFYDWYPDENETEVHDDAPRDLVPAMALLQARRGRLDNLEQSYLEECSSKGFSFYEILECWSGEGFKAKDVLTGELHDVIERSGSMTLKPSDMVFGKVVSLHGLTTLEACSVFIIPPKYKMGIVELREELTKEHGPVSHDVLREATLDVLEVYHELREAIENPKMPILQNTDGDLFVPHKLTFEIESAEAALDAILPMSFGLDRDEILDAAEKNDDGSIKSIEFPWLKKGNDKHKEWDNTVLGHIRIEGKKLLVDVNSVKRADIFEGELHERMPNAYKLKSKLIEPVEQHLKNRGGSENKSHQTKENEDLNNDPQIQAVLSKMMEKHWNSWVSEKLPALENKTPLEAIQSPKGRETLDNLLTQFERDAEVRPMPGQTVETFKTLRDRLGM